MRLHPKRVKTANKTAVGGTEVGADSVRDCDVLIAGAGMAGLAAGQLLAGAGLRVVCVEPEPFPRERVGESLDWSAPALLEGLGCPVEQLVDDGLGTYKRELRGIVGGLPTLVGRPPRWVERWPLRFTRVTAHVNRAAFDQVRYQQARDAGVVFVWDRVESVSLAGDRVVGGSTRSGFHFSCRWFLDASGRARFLARQVSIGRRHYGVPRIALWSQMTLPLGAEATTLYFMDDPDQLSWIWDIPIDERRHSIGVVMSLERFREARRSGRKPSEIMTQELARFPGFPEALRHDVANVESRTLHSYVSDRTSGANWFMIGEAGAFIDPLTSVGVTAAIRNGVEVASLIRESQVAGEVRPSDLADYDRRVRSIANLYNTAINDLLYSPELRRAVGFRWAARAYVVLGYITNSLYPKIVRPKKFRTSGVLLLVAVFRLWVGAWLSAARFARWRRTPNHPDPSIGQSGSRARSLS